MTSIWIMFSIFIIIFIVSLFVTSNLNPSQRVWILLDLWSILLATILLIKYKLPPTKQICTSAILALLVSFAYINTPTALFSGVKGFILTFIVSLSIFSTLSNMSKNKLFILRNRNKKEIGVSISIGILFGAVWGGVNYILMLSNQQPEFHLSINHFLLSLSPAIYEELVCRTLYFVFCLHLLQGQSPTKWQQFTCWFMMVVPHVMPHTPSSFLQGGPIGGIITTLLYIVIFGLPFAILQRKRDVTSAMIGHGLVDTIRFSFFGLPF